MVRFQCFHHGDGTVRWRLLGGNNRLMAVSSRNHPNADAAAREIADVRSHARTAPIVISLDDRVGLWSWQLTGPDGVLAASHSTFARRVDATLAVRRFRTVAPDAVLEPGVASFGNGRRGHSSQRPL